MLIIVQKPATNYNCIPEISTPLAHISKFIDVSADAYHIEMYPVENI